MMLLGRRGALGAAAAAVLLAGRPAAAAPWATDIGLYAEPTLAPVLRDIGRLFTARHGAGVAVLTAPPTLLLEQIQHNAAHDLLIVPSAFMDEAVKSSFVAPASRRDAWKNPLVIATAGTAPSTDLATLFASGPVAVTDPTVASALDGQSVLKNLDGAQAARIIGVANTGDAADLLLAGSARSALLYLTDVRARPGLSVAVSLAGSPPEHVAFALNPNPPSKNAIIFYDFLATTASRDRLSAAGLEISA